MMQTSKTVLVVDDEAIIRQLIRKRLEMDGYTIFEAVDGRNLGRLVSEQGVDLLILDILMDNKEGIETLVEVRDHDPELPIIMVSSDDDYLNLTKDMGATATISKPLDLDKLSNLVKQYLI